MRRTAAWLPIVVVGALLLPGCSADDDPPEPEATGAAPGSSGAEGPVLGASHELLPDPGGDGLLLGTTGRGVSARFFQGKA